MAVAFEASSSGQGQFGGTITITHPGIAPTAVGVLISQGDQGVSQPIVTSVTYGGVTMAQAVSVQDAGELAGATIFGLASPPPGSQSVVVTFNGSGLEYIVGVISVTGSDPVTCFDATNSVSGASAPATASLTTSSVNGDLVVDCISLYNTPAATVGGSQTSIFDTVQRNITGAGSYAPATGPTTTSWGVSPAGTGAYAYATASFKAAAVTQTIPQPTWGEVVLGG